MTDSTAIERIVMRRVRLIRLFALILSTTVLAALTLAAALWGIGREVWVAHILQNMPPSGDLVALARFSFSAFIQTTPLVQGLTLLTLISLVFLAREVAHLLSSGTDTNRSV